MKELNKFFEHIYKSSNKFNGEFIPFDELTPGTKIMEPKNHKVIGTFIKGVSSTDDLSEDEYDSTMVTYSDGKWEPLAHHDPFGYDSTHLVFIKLSEPKDGYDYGIEAYASDDWGLDSRDFLIATTEDEDFDDRSLDEKFPGENSTFESHEISPSDSRNIEINNKKRDEYYKSKDWY